MGPITVKVMDFESGVELARLAYRCIPMIGDCVQLEPDEGGEFYEVKKRLLPPLDENGFGGDVCIWVESEASPAISYV